MPNTANVLRLIAAIEAAPPDRFDMADYVNGNIADNEIQTLSTPPCGTSACIAGWAAFLSPQPILWPQNVLGKPSLNFFATGQDFLAISEDQANYLFLQAYANREQALAALRHLADTGIVAWPLGHIDPKYADEEAERQSVTFNSYGEIY